MLSVIIVELQKVQLLVLVHDDVKITSLIRKHILIKALKIAGLIYI